jgi:hypothetical protein
MTPSAAEKRHQMGRRILLGVLYVGLWLASAALALLAVIQLRQFLLFDFPIMVLMPAGLSRYGQLAIDRFGTVILGLLWLIYAIGSEAYFRRLLTGKIGIRQVITVFAAEVLIIGLAYVGTILVS